MMAITPRDSQTMYVTRIEHIGLFDPIVMTLMKSEDGGNTWSLQGELPGHMTTLYVLPKKGWLAANTVVGDLYLSSDDGKTWRFSPMQ